MQPLKENSAPPPKKQGARSYRKPGRGASTLVPQPKSPGPCAARPDSCWLVKVEDGHRSGLSRAELSLNALFPLPRGMSEVLKGTWQNRPPPSLFSGTSGGQGQQKPHWEQLSCMENGEGVVLMRLCQASLLTTLRNLNKRSGIPAMAPGF